jgi:inner membrane transporter RhtA
MAALLVLVGIITVQFGAGLAVLIFPELGPLGIVSLRIAFSAVLLLIIARPSLRGRTRRDWLTVVGYGLVIAVMNTTFYFSLERIPLGVAVTIEVLGPLIVSVVMGRRALSWVWAALAFIGVVVLCGAGFGRLDLLGVALAAIAGTCWALYILLAARTGQRFAKLDGLALAMAFGAIVTLPFGIATAGSAMLRPELLLIALGVAVLSSAIPYGVELIALRRIPESTFGVLMSIEPAVAALAGLLVLGQELTVIDIAAMALVIGASAGAVITSPPKVAPVIPNP